MSIYKKTEEGSPLRHRYEVETNNNKFVNQKQVKMVIKSRKRDDVR